MNRQLPLSIKLSDEATLSDFCWTGNALLAQKIDHLLHTDDEQLLYVWGPLGSGKSHLLQACCHALNASVTMYLPLALLKEWGPQTLEGLEEQHLICIDDLDEIAADSAWEEALFHCYNRLRDNQRTKLIISSQYSPTASLIHLPDLRSRLAWGLIIQINELADADKMITLQKNAHKRGFTLSTAVAQYVLSHYSRNMHDLEKILNILDDASLVAQRKITIPFVKSILNNGINGLT